MLLQSQTNTWRRHLLQLGLIDLLVTLQQAKALMQTLCAGRGDGLQQQ